EVDLQTLVQIERLAAERALHLGEATERERAAVASLNALQASEQRVSEMRAQWETGRTAWTAGAARARAVAEAAGKLSARASRWVDGRPRTRGNRADV